MESSLMYNIPTQGSEINAIMDSIPDDLNLKFTIMKNNLKLRAIMKQTNKWMLWINSGVTKRHINDNIYIPQHNDTRKKLKLIYAKQKILLVEINTSSTRRTLSMLFAIGMLVIIITCVIVVMLLI